MTPEFSRTIRIDTLGKAPRAVEIVATDRERAALAERLALVSIEELSTRLSLSREGDAVSAHGTLRASVTQSCVATGQALPASVDEEFAVLFLPQPDIKEGEEVELGAGEMDVTFYDEGAVDIGEAAAETLALSLDPYPRAPEAAAFLQKAGVRSQGEAKPASAFAGLRDMIERKS